MPLTLIVLVAVIAVFGGVVLLLICLIPAMLGLFSGLSGYAELARRFPAPQEPAGQKYEWQSIRIGAVRWRLSANIVFSAEGLYLSLMPKMPVLGNPAINRTPPVLIPWSEIKAAAPARLYWFPAVSLAIGDPLIVRIAIFRSFLPLIEQYSPVRL
jgi:hypothetical protein